MKKLVAGFLLAGSAISAAALAQGGEDIAAVQSRLVELGYKPGNTTGEWDPRTRNAVAFFQRRNGVSNANGYITDRTLVLLGLKQAAPQAVEKPAPVAPTYVAEQQPAPVYTPELVSAEPPEAVFEPAPPIAPVQQEAPQNAAITEIPTARKGTRISGVARIGAVFGGDSAFTTTAANATPVVDDPQVDFGGMIDAALGLNISLGNSPVSIQLTGGYRVQEEDRDDGKARVSAVPVNLTMFYSYDKFRFGVGAVGHINPTQYFETVDQNTKVKRILIDRTLDDALGGALEVAYSPIEESSFMVGIRYEGIEYDIPGQADKVDASTAGVFLGFGF